MLLHNYFISPFLFYLSFLFSNPHHIDPSSTLHRDHIYPTSTAHRPYIDPAYLNEIPPHFIHEITTKGYDVILR